MGAAPKLESTHVKVLDGASKAGWCDCGPGIQVKVLAIDPVKHSVEYLARTPPGHSTGLHRHHAEAYIFIVEGSVTNVTTGCEYRAGDLYYQPVGDGHEEVTGPNGAMAYVSQRGDRDLMAEFLNDKGEVIDNYNLSDFAKMLV
jgi:anti-sigma factor ChrR (cupin superfamily)